MRKQAPLSIVTVEPLAPTYRDELDADLVRQLARHGLEPLAPAWNQAAASTPATTPLAQGFRDELNAALARQLERWGQEAAPFWVPAPERIQ